jgi:hypothetical protein
VRTAPQHLHVCATIQRLISVSRGTHHAAAAAVQDAAKAVVLPVNQVALSRQVQVGSVLDLARYLTPDAEDESVRLTVQKIDAASGDFECIAKCARRAE